MQEKTRNFSLFSFIRNGSFQNFAFLSFIQSSNILISLISMPILIQSLGVDQFGMVSLALSVVLLANYFVDFGFSINTPRDVAINRHNIKFLSALFSKVMCTKITVALVSAFLLTCSMAFFGFFQGYQVILAYSFLLMFAEAISVVWLFQGMEKLKMASLGNAVGKLAYLVAIILVVETPEEAKWVNFLMGGSNLLIQVLLGVYAFKTFKLEFVIPNLKASLNVLTENIYLLFSNLAVYISTKGGILILSFFTLGDTLGMFSLAERPVMILRLFPSLLVQAVYPSASRKFIEDRPGFLRLIRKAYVSCIGAGFLISCLTFLGSSHIVWLLSGERLSEATHFLMVMSFVPFLACLNVINMLIILVTGEKKSLMKISIAMCLCMVPVCLLFVKAMGEIGVGYGLLLTELLVFFISLAICIQNNRELYKELVNGEIRSHHIG